jgi:Flp pilus assembly protein TadD
MKDKEKSPIIVLSYLLLLLLLAACQPLKISTNSNKTAVIDAASQQDALTLYIKARNDYSAGNMATAESELKHVIELKPIFSDAYLYLGNIYFRQKRFDEAHIMYSQCLALDKNNVSALYNASILDIVLAYEKLEQLELLLPDNHKLQQSTALFKSKLQHSLNNPIERDES